MCPEESSELISRPEIIESLEDGTTTVNGECVENSSTVSGTSPIVQCSNMGQWQVVIPCLCNPGYELNDDQCTGIYKVILALSPQLYIRAGSSVGRALGIKM